MRLRFIVKWARLIERSGICLANHRIAEQKSLVFSQVRIVGPTKPFSLVFGIVLRADEVSYLGHLQQAMNIVIVPHEVGREVRLFLLQAKFR